MTRPATDSVLERIVAETRASLPARRRARPESALHAQAAARPAPRDFVAALSAPGLGLVAEVKKGSPSKGPFARDLDHVAAARAFRDGGAVAISVLTAPAFFAGDAELDDVATALAVDPERCPPLLRKEFIVDPYQVLESRALGADAFLIIVKTIPDAAAIGTLIDAGRELGMAAFVEVTDESELNLAFEAGAIETGALESGAGAIGINNRDLHTFEEDLSTTERLRPLVPDGVAVVAASGMRTPDDLARMRACDVDAVLIGEGLTRGDDIPGAISSLFPEGLFGGAP